MQIVIDIDDSKLWEIKNEPIEKNFNIYELASYIDKGIPLPKGHGRLIDISPYEKYFNVAITYDDGNHIHQNYMNMIPTIVEADKENKI